MLDKTSKGNLWVNLWAVPVVEEVKLSLYCFELVIGVGNGNWTTAKENCWVLSWGKTGARLRGPGLEGPVEPTRNVPAFELDGERFDGYPGLAAAESCCGCEREFLPCRLLWTWTQGPTLGVWSANDGEWNWVLSLSPPAEGTDVVCIPGWILSSPFGQWTSECPKCPQPEHKVGRFS